MANYANLKADIQAVIKQNGNQEITGNLLQQSLIAMITSLGNGYLYKGIATPSTNPGSPDQNIFYIATVAGTYVNMGGFTLDDGEVAIIKYNGSWSKDITGIASLQKLSQLEQEIDNKMSLFPKGSIATGIVSISTEFDFNSAVLTAYVNRNNTGTSTRQIIDMTFTIGSQDYRYRYTTTTGEMKTGYELVQIPPYESEGVGNVFVGVNWLPAPMGYIPEDAPLIIVKENVRRILTDYAKKAELTPIQNGLMQLEQKVSNLLIELVGMGTKSGGNSGVTAVGDRYYNTFTNELRECTSFVSATDFNDVIIPFVDGAIYTFDGYTYIWDGTGLIKTKAALTVEKNEKTGSYVLLSSGQSLNQFGLLGQQEFAETFALTNLLNRYTNQYAATSGTGAVRVGNDKITIGKRHIIKVVAESNFTLTQIGLGGSTGVIVESNSMFYGEVAIKAGTPFFFEFYPTSAQNYITLKGAENVNYDLTLFYTENDNIGELATLKTVAKTNVVGAINEVIANERYNAVKDEANYGYLTTYTLRHLASDDTEILRLNLPMSQYSGKKCVIAIVAQESFTMTSIYRCYSSGSSAQVIATNISLEQGVPFYIDFVFSASTVAYIKFEGGANKGFVATMLLSFGDRVGSLHGDFVPYYYDTQLSQAIPAIQANVQRSGRNSESFIFITDPHWAKNHQKSPMLIRYVIAKTGINLFVNGGDIINDTDRQGAVDEWMGYIHANNYGIETHYCYGNHDGNRNEPIDTSVPLAPIENLLGYNAIYAISHKPYESTEHYLTSEEWSYYFDREYSKTRFIVLDAGNSANFTHRVNVGGITSVVNNTETIEAFLSVLSSTPAGYNIVLITHSMRTGANWENITIVMNIIDAYNSRGSYTYNGNTYDYSNTDGKIVCVFAGHEHQDKLFTTTGGVPIFVTDTDGYTTNSESGANFDTINEQCFDVVTVDYDTQMVYCVRIGRGSNREHSITI